MLYVAAMIYLDFKARWSLKSLQSWMDLFPAPRLVGYMDTIVFVLLRFSVF